jgi:hypothetical protein
MKYVEYLAQIEELKLKYPVQFEPGCLFEYGFSISPGWFGLFSELCEELQNTLAPNVLERFRWQQIKEKFAGLRAYYKFIPNPEYLAKYRAAHPEDFSCYFFYCDDEEDKAELMKEGYIPVPIDWHETVNEIINRYEHRAAQSCEICGSNGEKYTIGAYITIRCEKHANTTSTTYDDDVVDAQRKSRKVTKVSPHYPAVKLK